MTRKNGLLSKAAMLPLLLLFSLALSAGNPSFQLDFASRYIWRGFDMNPANKPVFKPSVTLAFADSGLALNFWGSISLHDSAFTETDLTLIYTFKTPETIALSAGFTHYGWYFNENFSFKNNTSQEFYLSVGLPQLALRPALALYLDITNGSGLYATLDLGHTLVLGDDLKLDLFTRLGFNSRQWIEETGFSDLTLGATLPFSAGKVTVAPFINLTLILLDAVNPMTDSELCFGFYIAY